jgi:hypothetical protein
VPNDVTNRYQQTVRAAGIPRDIELKRGLVAHAVVEQEGGHVAAHDPCPAAPTPSLEGDLQVDGGTG